MISDSNLVWIKCVALFMLEEGWEDFKYAMVNKTLLTSVPRLLNILEIPRRRRRKLEYIRLRGIRSVFKSSVEEC